MPARKSATSRALMRSVGAVETLAPALRHGARIGEIGVEQVAHDRARPRRARASRRGARYMLRVEEGLQLLLAARPSRARRRRSSRRRRARRRRSAGFSASRLALRRRDHVLDHAGDLAAHQLVAGAHGVEAGIARRARSRRMPAGQRTVVQHVERQQAGAQAVVDVMRVVGDVVGDRRALRLEAGVAGRARDRAARE